MVSRPFLVGTRKSPLALAQTNGVLTVLRQLFPGQEFQIRTITTAGDRMLDRSFLSDHQGVFVKEIEEALLAREIDLAVHSLKDMPCETPAALELAAVCERANPCDALISSGAIRFQELKAGAVIGTSSIRRRAQLLAARPEFRIIELRGNVDTRLRKLEAGDMDAIVIAAAGVLRLGREEALTEVLPPDVMLPAPCQGAVAIEIRKNDAEVKSLVAQIDHAASRACVMAERSFLRELGGGCSLPIAALAEVNQERLMLTGEVLSPDGRNRFRSQVSGPAKDAVALGVTLAREALRSSGEWIRSALKSPFTRG